MYTIAYFKLFRTEHMTNFKVRRFIRRIPISRRIILLVFLGSIIPILIANLFAYSQARSAVLNTAMEYNVQILGLIKQNMKLSSERGRNFVDELLIDPLIRTSLKEFKTLDDSEKNNLIRAIARVVRQKAKMLEYIEDTRLVTTDNSQIYSLSHIYIHPEILDTHYQKIRNSNKKELWYFSSRQGRPVIHLSRKIIHIGTLEPQGYLLQVINPALINNPKISFSEQERLQLMLIDSFGNTFHLGDDKENRIDQATIETIIHTDKTGVITRFTGDSKHFICYFHDTDLDWTVVSSIPYADLYLSAESILWTTILMAVILLGICLGISHIIIRSITQPLNVLISSVNKASTLKFATPLADEADDELGYMAKAYNKVVLRVQELLIQVEGEQNEKRRAEVKMLQAQINPHFLFNTLDSLRFAATMSNAPSVSSGLSALSHLLRNSIVSSEPVITMEQEVKNIQDYLTIQTIRYGNCIRFQPTLDKKSKKAKIMKLLLQPIVENSIIHGMKDNDSDILITLNATVQDGRTSITICDDGRGFDLEEKMDKSTSKFKNSKLSGIGLENVKERLKLQYGDSQSFKLESMREKGTLVQITFTYEPLEGGSYV